MGPGFFLVRLTPGGVSGLSPSPRLAWGSGDGSGENGDVNNGGLRGDF